MLKSKDTKLFNVMFPVWFLFLHPIGWLFIFPINFLIDSLVLLISLYAFKIEEKKLWYKKYIFKIFAFGMLSDIIGAAFMFFLMFLGVEMNGYDFHLTIPGLIMASGLIFVFNYFITFRKTEMPYRFKMALIFATVTAPYTFLIPTSLIY